jgi:N-acetyl-gamma-glutamylphosphate reductase
MTNAEVFKLADDIEILQQEFYSRLVDIFSHVPEVSNFWKDMEKDEVIHSQALQRIVDSVPHDQLRSLATPYIVASASKVLEMSADDRVKSIKNLDDAYEMAHEQERSELNMVYNFLVVHFSLSNDIKRFALAELEKHVQKLTDFTATHGDEEWRKSIRVKE